MFSSWKPNLYSHGNYCKNVKWEVNGNTQLKHKYLKYCTYTYDWVVPERECYLELYCGLAEWKSHFNNWPVFQHTAHCMHLLYIHIRVLFIMLNQYRNFRCLRSAYSRFFGRSGRLSHSFLFLGVISAYFTYFCNYSASTWPSHCQVKLGDRDRFGYWIWNNLIHKCISSVWRGCGMPFGPVGVQNAFAVRPQKVHLPVDIIHADPQILIVFHQLCC